MHERERHRLILRAVGERPVVTVAQLVDMLDVSEATIRRDIAALDQEGKLRTPLQLRGDAIAFAHIIIGETKRKAPSICRATPLVTHVNHRLRTRSGF